MDPESGRCRRTDGKKWRCRRDVVPNTKYCERHTNRGRSRKLVETAEITPDSNTPPITSSHSNTLTTPRTKMRRKTIKPCNSAYTSAKLPTPIPENHQSKIQSLNRSEGLTTDATITTPAADGRSKTDDEIVKNDKSFRSATSSASNHNDDNIGNCIDITPGTATAKIDGTDSVSVIAGDLDVRDAGSKCSKDEMNKRNSSDVNRNGGSMIPQVSTTSKTVVHGDTIEKENNPVYIRGCVTAEELHRCKRTDGKRWRCSREAIPGEKYCDSHMHRGSKRLKSEGVTVAATHIPVAIPKSDHKNVSTDLSISLGKSPEPITIDLDSSTSGRSSDSTTVTDTSASQFLVRPRVSLK